MVDRVPPGVIRADEAYTLQEFRRRCGLGDLAWHRVKQKLTRIKIGRRIFVRGADWLALLGDLASEQQRSNHLTQDQQSNGHCTRNNRDNATRHPDIS
jgi:hypothetical protein